MGLLSCHCVEEYQELVALERRFRERGLRVLGILHRESPRRALRFMEGQNQSPPTTSGELRGARTSVTWSPHQSSSWTGDQERVNQVLLPASASEAYRRL